MEESEGKTVPKKVTSFSLELIQVREDVRRKEKEKLKNLDRRKRFRRWLVFER